MDAATLMYPQHIFKPEDLLTFIEMKPFSSRWKELGLTDDELLTLQIAIMCDPARSPVVPGTGGLRKLRFAPPKWNAGKSGALRVGYVFFDEYKKVLLVLVYQKSRKDNLSQAEKVRIKAAIERIEKEFVRRSPN